MNGAIRGVAVEIHERDLARTKDFGSLLYEMEGDLFGRIGDRYPFDAMGIEQKNPIIFIGRLGVAKPCPKLISRRRVIRPFEKAPHETGKGGVFVKDRGIRQALRSPIHQLIHFQFGDGRKLAPYLIAKMSSIITIEEETASDNASREDHENQKEANPRAALGFVVRVHHHTPLMAHRPRPPSSLSGTPSCPGRTTSLTGTVMTNNISAAQYGVQKDR